MTTGRVVILTALNVEYSAVRKRMTGLRVHTDRSGTRFEIGRMGGTSYEVVLGLVGKGNHPAAVLTERAIREFSPRCVLFVGVAGALWPSIKLGDIVVASQVYAYHGGTSDDDGLKARPRTWETSHWAAQLAQHLIRTEEWLEIPTTAPVPTAHFGAVAAGEIVQDSTLSDQAQWIRKHYNDALAIEMEAAGVAQAGHLNESLPIVVIRGISDRADGNKTVTDTENWQSRAAANAAAFAAALVPHLSAGRADEDGSGKDGRATMGDTYRNLATGNARVGVQAGQIHGNVGYQPSASAPVDILSGIAELRALIKEAHRDGLLDPDTYAAAESELDTASGNPADTSKVVLALKRLRGLVIDLAAIATAVGSVLAALQRQS